MPENGDPLLFPILATVNTIDLGLIIAMQAIFFSMLADLVEHSEVKTGRRNEGRIFLRANVYSQNHSGRRCVRCGSHSAGGGVSPRCGPRRRADRVGAPAWAHLLVPSQWVLWGVMLVALAYYRLDRAQHQSNSDCHSVARWPLRLGCRRSSARCEPNRFGWPSVSWHTDCQ